MEQHSTPSEALKRAVDIAGGQRATSRICGTSQTAVWKWLQSPKGIPAEYVLRVEAATGVSRHALRPDIYPIEHAPPSYRWTGRDMRADGDTRGGTGASSGIGVALSPRMEVRHG